MIWDPNPRIVFKLLKGRGKKFSEPFGDRRCWRRLT